MTDSQARALRPRLSRHRSGRGKRYPAALRADVGRWARERRAAGNTWGAVASELGMKMETVRRWAKAKTSPKQRRRALPVEVALDAIGMRVISPSGYRVEGVSLDEVVALLRELS